MQASAGASDPSGVRALALALAAAVATGSVPAAADNLWVVTNVEVGKPRPGDRASARKLEQALRARGFDVIDGPSASSELERRHSRAPRVLPAEQSAALDVALRKLADDLASENLAQAQQELGEIETLTPYERDQLNHDGQRARRRFHICLLAGHLFSKEGFQQQAFEQVRKCARDFPGFVPEQSPYQPESIRNFFAQAQQELQTLPPSNVHVDVENAGDEVCNARINGIDRGPTPATIQDVRTERVRIQVDCGGRPGRIYEVRLVPNDNTVRIDPQLDRAIQTSGGLSLRYADSNTAANNRMLHSLRLARAIGASYLLQVWDGELLRIDVDTRRETVIAPMSQDLDALVELLMTGPTSVGVAAPSGATQPVAALEESGPYAPLAWVSAGAGVLAGTGALIAFLVREGAVKGFNERRIAESDPDRLACTSRFAFDKNPDCANFLSTADAAETASWVLGFAGIGFVGLSAMLFVRDAQDDTRESVANGCGPGGPGLTCQLAF